VHNSIKAKQLGRKKYMKCSTDIQTKEDENPTEMKCRININKTMRKKKH